MNVSMNKYILYNPDKQIGGGVLHEEVKSNNIDEVIKLLEQVTASSDVNVTDISGRIPLHYASTIEIAKLLIDKGANLNQKDIWGVNPICMAIKNQYNELANYYTTLDNIDVTDDCLYTYIVQTTSHPNMGSPCHHTCYGASYHAMSPECKKCVGHANDIRSMLSPFDEYRSLLQGVYIREYLYNDLLDIFQNTFKFNFSYEMIYEHQDQWIDVAKYKNKNLHAIIHNFKIRENYHFNIHIIFRFKNKNFVYIYEPLFNKLDDYMMLLNKQFYDGDYITYFENVKKYRSNGYIVLAPPYNIIIQDSVALCYMYVLHFLLNMLLFNNDFKMYRNNITAVHDIYIMKFTKDMLKILHEYGKISNSVYYLLTNNIYNIKKNCNKEGYIDIDLSLVNSKEMLLTLSSCMIKPYFNIKNVYHNKNLSIQFIESNKLLYKSFVNIKFIDYEPNYFNRLYKTHLKKTIETMIDIGASSYEFLRNLVDLPDIVKWLIEKYKIDIYKIEKDIEDCTILYKLSILKNSFETIEYIIEGIDKNNRIKYINKRCKSGNTALLGSMQRSGRETIGIDLPLYLIENGAMVDVTNNDGNSPLHLASDIPNGIYVVKKIIEKIKETGGDVKEYIDRQNSRGNSALMNFLIKKDVAIYLIENGADLNLINKNEDTVLHIVSTIPDGLDVVKKVIEKIKETGGDVKEYINRKNSDDQNVIEFTKKISKHETSKYLEDQLK